MTCSIKQHNLAPSQYFLGVGARSRQGYLDYVAEALMFEVVPSASTIADDSAAMKAVYALLEPGGTFTLLVPNHPALLGRFDRDIGHHRRYTKGELRRKLEASGFVVERIRRSNPVGALGWLVNIRLLRQRRLRGASLFDRLVPALMVLDRVEMPLGLSLIAVARKPS